MKPKETLEHYVLSSSPHCHAKCSVSRIMLDVIIALLPATAVGIWFFGMAAVWTIAVCVTSCLLTEIACRWLMKRESTIGDLSAIVTGLLLALNLPAGIPLWMAIVGSVFAIFVAKQVFGGIGMNPFNPALAARAFMLISFTGPMTTWLVPNSHGAGAWMDRTAPIVKVEASTHATQHAEKPAEKAAAVAEAAKTVVAEAETHATQHAEPVVEPVKAPEPEVETHASQHEAEPTPAVTPTVPVVSEIVGPVADSAMHVEAAKPAAEPEAVTCATPLASSWERGSVVMHSVPSLWHLAIGYMPGCIGEISTIALALGCIYLLIRKVITWHIPTAFLLTVFFYALIAGRSAELALAHVMTGGVMIGACFMATDYVTSPLHSLGKLIFGVGCGVICMLIRQFGSYPEGCSFAILIMNSVCPLINRWTQPKPFGAKK